MDEGAPTLKAIALIVLGAVLGAGTVLVADAYNGKKHRRALRRLLKHSADRLLDIPPDPKSSPGSRCL